MVIKGRKGDTVVDTDEHPRADTTAEAPPGCLSMAKAIRSPPATPGVNDGAAAMILASAEAVQKYGLAARPGARHGQCRRLPRIMGYGPVPAVKKLCERLKLAVSDFDVIELNEAFAAQGLAVTRDLGLADDDARVNPNGGAYRPGHPLGMSGARLVLDNGPSTGEIRRQAGPGDHVRRGRPGVGAGGGAGLTGRGRLACEWARVDGLNSPCDMAGGNPAGWAAAHQPRHPRRATFTPLPGYVHPAVGAGGHLDHTDPSIEQQGIGF